MKTPATARAVLQKLEAQHPGADTELHYANAYQLLVATVLSAQSTDRRVNDVTPRLFERYPDATALAAAELTDLEPLIRSTGFFRSKSRSLSGLARKLVEEHGGTVPASMAALTTLPGVGRKTANVVLGHALGVPGLPVDRHVLRVANRIGLATSDDPEVVETQLGKIFTSDVWTRVSDTLILHGRRICRPRPLCEQCAVRDFCDYYREIEHAGAKAPALHRERVGAKAPASQRKRVGATGPARHRKRARAQTSASTRRKVRLTKATKK
jgi:endonuclease-3